MSRKNKIILVGFMGTGKSSVAASLSQKLNAANIDVDQEIVTSACRSIPEIFAQDGEEAFRELETKVLQQLVLSEESAVIATGGGAVLKSLNCELMLAHGLVIALHASPDIIINRVSKDQGRPLLQGDVSERVHTLMKARKHAYDFAHLTIDTSDLTIDQIVSQIVEAWQTADYDT